MVIAGAISWSLRRRVRKLQRAVDAIDCLFAFDARLVQIDVLRSARALAMLELSYLLPAEQESSEASSEAPRRLASRRP